MSDALICDFCGAAAPLTTDRTHDWVYVKVWGTSPDDPGRVVGDFCWISHALMKMIQDHHEPHLLVAEVLSQIRQMYELSQLAPEAGGGNMPDKESMARLRHAADWLNRGLKELQPPKDLSH